MLKLFLTSIVIALALGCAVQTVPVETPVPPVETPVPLVEPPVPPIVPVSLSPLEYLDRMGDLLDRWIDANAQVSALLEAPSLSPLWSEKVRAASLPITHLPQEALSIGPPPEYQEVHSVFVSSLTYSAAWASLLIEAMDAADAGDYEGSSLLLRQANSEDSLAAAEMKFANYLLDQLR